MASTLRTVHHSRQSGVASCAHDSAEGTSTAGVEPDAAPRVAVLDEVPEATALRDLLSRSGFVIADGRNAADPPSAPHVVLVERPPGLDGVPFVIVDREPSADARAAATAAGAAGYFGLPLDGNALVAAVHAAAVARRLQVGLERRIADLATLVQSNRCASTAVGVLMERYHLSPSDAYERLRRYARARRRKVHEVAEEIVASHEALTLGLESIARSDGKA